MSRLPLQAQSQLADIYFIIDPSRFHVLKFILEGYDNLGILSSINRKEGVVRIKTSHDSVNELMTLIADIASLIKKSTL